ncbi:MAG: nitroreductase family protein [Fidelibacterota bacterium]
MKPPIHLQFKRKPEQDMIKAAKEFYTKVSARRTVRTFAPDAIPNEVIDYAIAAAGTAPSGANLQPWHFVVVRDPKIRQQIRQQAEANEREFYSERAPEEWLDVLRPLGTDEHKSFLDSAPCLIVVNLKKAVLWKGQPHKTYYPVESVGLATGILITALHLAGVATLTYTPSPMGFLNDILDRPASERPYMILVCGYPADGTVVPRLTRLPLEEIVSRF